MARVENLTAEMNDDRPTPPPYPYPPLPPPVIVLKSDEDQTLLDDDGHYLIPG